MLSLGCGRTADDATSHLMAQARECIQRGDYAAAQALIERVPAEALDRAAAVERTEIEILACAGRGQAAAVLNQLEATEAAYPGALPAAFYVQVAQSLPLHRAPLDILDLGARAHPEDAERFRALRAESSRMVLPCSECKPTGIGCGERCHLIFVCDKTGEQWATP